MEQQLNKYYMGNARVADMKGYGLSGGTAGTYYGPMDSFRMPGFSLGASQLNPMGVGAGMRAGCCGCPTCGSGVYTPQVPSAGGQYGVGLSGGRDSPSDDEDRTRGVFGDAMSGGKIRQCRYNPDSGRCKRKHSEARIMAGRKAAASNPWITKVKAYAAEKGITYKQAMIALKTF